MPSRTARRPGRPAAARARLVSPLALLTAVLCAVALVVPVPVSGPGGSPAPGAPSEPRALATELVSQESPEPTTLLSVLPGDGSVTLTWAPTSEDFGAYGIWVDGVWEYDVDRSAGTTSVVYGGLTNGQEHEFAVTVVTWTYPGGEAVWHESPLSNRIRDAAGDYPPGRPATPSASAAEAATTVTWARSTEADVAEYVLLRTGGGATDTAVARVSQPASGSVSTVDRTGVKGERYTYAVKAVDARGHTSPASAASNQVEASNIFSPGAPDGLRATARNRSVTLTWTLGSEADLKGYTVKRDGSSVAFVTAPEHGFTDTGLVNGRQYSYAVQSVDHGGNTSIFTSSVRATPYDDDPPAVPVGLSATAGDGQVLVSWTANTEPDLAGYDLFRDGVRTAGAVLGAGATSYTDTGVVADRTYSYQLRTRDTNGNPSAVSASVSATPFDHTPPAVPARPTATAGDSAVDLSWTANSERDLATYQVLRDGAVIATVLRRNTTYRDTSVSNGTTYGYALRAVDSHDNASGATAPEVRVTPLDQTAPAPPAGLTAARGDGRVTLTWSASSERDLTGYQVLRGGVVVGTVAAPGTTFTDTGLTNNQTYAYSLVARDTSGNASAPSSPDVSATPTDLTPPAAPRNVTYTPGDTVVDLAWQANSEPDLASYRVYRDDQLIATIAVVAAPGTTPTSYRDTGLANGVQRRYAVAAVDTHGNESVRATDAATPVDRTPPDAPGGLGATAGDGQVALTWQASAATDTTTYRVFRDGTEIATVPSGTRSFTDTGLADGRSYSYAVLAVDGSGNRSALSTAVSAVPRDTTAPGAPTGVTATPGDGSASVSWTAPADTDLATYRVMAGSRELGRVGAPASGLVVSGLTNGTAVTITVVVLDRSGNTSPASAPVTVTPVAATPPTSAVVPASGSAQSGALAVSSDGRWIVVSTTARLEGSDTNDTAELYRLDTTGTLPARRVAPIGASGATADANAAADVAISYDGRFVALASRDALSGDGTAGTYQVFRGDLSLASTTWALVSAPVSGTPSSTPGTTLSAGPTTYTSTPSVAMSADGSRVAFYSAAQLVPTDTDTSLDLYVKDLPATTPSRGPVTRASSAANGAALGRVAVGPAVVLTPDGRYVLFTATGPDGPVVAIRKDLGTTSGSTASSSGGVKLASTSPPATGSYFVGVDTDTGDLSMSADGRYAAFSTVNKITTSDPGANYSKPLAYRKDLSTGAVVAVGTGVTNRWEHQVTLSPDGRYAAFLTTARGITTDTNMHTDVYRRDLSAPASDPLVLVTSDSTGAVTTFPTSPSTPSERDENGRVVLLDGGTAVVVTVQPLLGGDTNAVRDVYVKQLSSGAVTSPVETYL